MKAPKKASVLLADEQTLFMEGLARVCEETQRYRVVGHCSDGRVRRPDDSLDRAGYRRPGPGIAQDVRPGGGSGGAPGRQYPEDRDPLHAPRPEDRARVSAEPAPMATCSRATRRSCLLDALDEVLGGSIYVSPQFKLADVFSTSEDAPPQKPYEQLSAREHQVFTLLVDGLRSKEIADQLDLSPKTVNTYRSNLMNKLNIHDLPGLVKFAIRKKLIPLG